jgi:predicted dehydrogenase
LQIRIAAIGVGHWHSLYDAAYLKTLLGMPEATLVGVHDPDRDLAAQRASQLGNPPAYTDYQEMLAKIRPDFVIALGRHKDMAAVGHHLLDSGYPFLMEKPMAIDATELRAVADKAAQKRTFVAVPFFQRYHPFVACARVMLADSAFGQVSHFYCRAIRPTSERYVAWGCPWMLDPSIAGGGSLRNTGLHGIDLFLALFGGEATVTGAQVSSRALGQRVEDFASVLLRSERGVLATIETGNTFPGQGGDVDWRIAGSDALLSVRAGAVWSTTRSGAKQIADAASEPLAAIALRDALKRWRSGEPPATGIEDCYRAMRIVDQAYAAAAKTT